MRRAHKYLLTAATTAALLAGGAGIASATPPSPNVPPPTVIDSGVVGPLHVHTRDFKLFQKQERKFIVVTFRIPPRGQLGWHSHPGPVLIAVDTGTLAIEHSNCTYSFYRHGTAEVEQPKQVHNAKNLSRHKTVTGTAVYLNVPLTPGAQRIDEPAPACAR